MMTNKPVIKYYDNGQKEFEVYYLDGKRHREDGPAAQWWYKNGQKEMEIYYLDDKRHREDGPAYQWWYDNGQKCLKKYHLDGKEYSRRKWLVKLRKEKLELLKNI